MKQLLYTFTLVSLLSPSKLWANNSKIDSIHQGMAMLGAATSYLLNTEPIITGVLSKQMSNGIKTTEVCNNYKSFLTEMRTSKHNFSEYNSYTTSNLLKSGSKALNMDKKLEEINKKFKELETSLDTGFKKIEDGNFASFGQSHLDKDLPKFCLEDRAIKANEYAFLQQRQDDFLVAYNKIADHHQVAIGEAVQFKDLYFSKGNSFMAELGSDNDCGTSVNSSARSTVKDIAPKTKTQTILKSSQQ